MSQRIGPHQVTFWYRIRPYLLTVALTVLGLARLQGIVDNVKDTNTANDIRACERANDVRIATAQLARGLAGDRLTPASEALILEYLHAVDCHAVVKTP